MRILRKTLQTTIDKITHTNSIECEVDNMVEKTNEQPRKPTQEELEDLFREDEGK